MRRNFDRAGSRGKVTAASAGGGDGQLRGGNDNDDEAPKTSANLLEATIRLRGYTNKSL